MNEEKKNRRRKRLINNTQTALASTVASLLLQDLKVLDIGFLPYTK
jgi:hypothetical protein